MLKYSFKVVEHTFGKQLTINFEEKGYELLSTFFRTDVSDFPKWIKRDFDEVLTGETECKETTGDTYGLEICPDTTKIEILTGDDCCKRKCKVDTRELRKLIDIWCEKERELEQEQKIC